MEMLAKEKIPTSMELRQHLSLQATSKSVGHLFFQCITWLLNLYYWFGVGEGTFQIHHLNFQFTPGTFTTPTLKH
jgi:hypothetical protein